MVNSAGSVSGAVAGRENSGTGTRRFGRRWVGLFRGLSRLRIAPSQIGEPVGGGRISAAGVNLLELLRQFRGPPLVARAKMMVEQKLERLGVAGNSLQDDFEEIDGLLRQTIAGKELHVRERLGDESLRLLIDRPIRRVARRGGRCPLRLRQALHRRNRFRRRGRRLFPGWRCRGRFLRPSRCGRRILGRCGKSGRLFLGWRRPVAL